ncbi:hypothetical protein M5E87_08880 [Flavonifractor plautii]|nr:hypothetical protein M5E87_08880 [Flavonifractor plautii]
MPGFGRLRVAPEPEPTPTPRPASPLSRGGRVRPGLLPRGRVPPHHRLQPHQPGPGGLLYEGLFALDGQFQPQEALCASASVSADGLQWSFIPRSGVTFSDGSP